MALLLEVITNQKNLSCDEDRNRICSVNVGATGKSSGSSKYDGQKGDRLKILMGENKTSCRLQEMEG